MISNKYGIYALLLLIVQRFYSRALPNIEPISPETSMNEEGRHFRSKGIVGEITERYGGIYREQVNVRRERFEFQGQDQSGSRALPTMR